MYSYVYTYVGWMDGWMCIVQYKQLLYRSVHETFYREGLKYKIEADDYYDYFAQVALVKPGYFSRNSRSSRCGLLLQSS